MTGMSRRDMMQGPRKHLDCAHLLGLADRLKLAFVLDYAEPGFRLTAKDVITLELCLRFTAAQMHDEEMTDGTAH
jgi:hypothetical protein